MKKQKFYAVKEGRQTGIFKTWEECNSQVARFPGAQFKSFDSEEEARQYLEKTRPREQREECHELTAGQRRALEILESGKNVFLTGEAGTGKSYVVREFIRKNRGRNLMVCAPTGIAALQVNGVTLHRAFRIPIKPLPQVPAYGKIPKTVQKADVVLIDEVSMARVDVFDFVAGCIMKVNDNRRRDAKITGMAYRPVQLVVIGDFFQLPPVVDERSAPLLENAYGRKGVRFAFQGTYWDLFDFETISLDEPLRQRDPDFIRGLNQIRRGDPAGIPWMNAHSGPYQENGICLCPTNALASRINTEKLSEIPEEEEEYAADTTGAVSERDAIAEMILKLKKGARVMTLVNDPREAFRNGSLGTVRDLQPDKIQVAVDGGSTVWVEPYTWEIKDYFYNEEDKKLEEEVIGSITQFPLKLAYAVTIHKSQGQTYSSVNLFPNCFENGQLYVALSRAESLEGLHLMADIRPRDLRTSREVAAFDRPDQQPEEGNI